LPADIGPSGAHDNENTARLKAVAWENDISVKTLRDYRAVAATFLPPPVTGLSVAFRHFWGLHRNASGRTSRPISRFRA
jgi:hypothetical protein